MFERSRRRIFAAVILAAVILLAAVFISIYTVSVDNMRRHHKEEMHIAIDHLSGETADPAGNDARLNQDIVVVKMTPTGQVDRVNTERERMSEEEILRIADGLFTNKRESGTYRGYLFVKEERQDGVYVAFLLDTLQNKGMRVMLRNTMIVGGCATAVIALIAWFFSGWVMIPLKENARNQQQFLSDAGHELKTPVAVINANADLLEREIGENRWLSNIRTENGRMGMLVSDMLDLVRDETNMQKTESIDLTRLVQGELLLFESVAYERGKKIEFNGKEEVNVEGRHEQLERVIGILMDNAISYTKGEGPITVTVRKTRNHAEVRVQNPAEDLTDEQVRHLFDRFFRVDEARTGEQKHYGLGLPIARKVIEGHRGQIEAESSNGHFLICFRIPLEQ